MEVTTNHYRSNSDSANRPPQNQNHHYNQLHYLNNSRSSVNRNQNINLYQAFNQPHHLSIETDRKSFSNRSKESCLPFSLNHNHNISNSSSTPNKQSSSFLNRSSSSQNGKTGVQKNRSITRSSQSQTFRRQPSPVPAVSNNNLSASLDRSSSSVFQSALKLPAALFSRRNRHSNPISLSVSAPENFQQLSGSASTQSHSNRNGPELINITNGAVVPNPHPPKNTNTSQNPHSRSAPSFDPKLYPISPNALSLTRDPNNPGIEPALKITEPTISNNNHPPSVGRTSLDQFPLPLSKPGPQTGTTKAKPVVERRRESSLDLTRSYRSRKNTQSPQGSERDRLPSTPDIRSAHDLVSGYQPWAARSAPLVKELKTNNTPDNEKDHEHQPTLDLGIAITTDVPQQGKFLRSKPINPDSRTNRSPSPSPPASSTPSLNRSSPPTQSSKRPSTQSDQQQPTVQAPNQPNNDLITSPHLLHSPVGLKPLYAPQLEKGKVPAGVLPRRPIGATSPPPPQQLSPGSSPLDLRKRLSNEYRRENEGRGSVSNLSQGDFQGSQSHRPSESLSEPWPSRQSRSGLSQSIRLSASPIIEEEDLEDEPFQAWLTEHSRFDLGSDPSNRGDLIFVRLNIGGTIFMTRAEVLTRQHSRLRDYLRTLIGNEEQKKITGPNKRDENVEGDGLTVEEEDEKRRGREKIWLESGSESSRDSSVDLEITSDGNQRGRNHRSEILDRRSGSLRSSVTKIEERSRFSPDGEDDIDGQTMVGNGSRFSFEPTKQMKNSLMTKIVEEEEENKREFVAESGVKISGVEGDGEEGEKRSQTNKSNSNSVGTEEDLVENSEEEEEEEEEVGDDDKKEKSEGESFGFEFEERILKIEIFLDRNPSCYGLILDCLRYPNRVDRLIEVYLSKIGIHNLNNNHNNNNNNNLNGGNSNGSSLNQGFQKDRSNLLKEVLIEVKFLGIKSVEKALMAKIKRLN